MTNMLSRKKDKVDDLAATAGHSLAQQAFRRMSRSPVAITGAVITGLFQDELPHLPSWGKDFAASFTREYGYDLRERLPLLWAGDGDQARRVRRDYHAHRAELAARAFFAPYALAAVTSRTQAITIH